MLILLSLFTSVAMSCGDDTYRCVNPNATPAQEWEHTETCMARVGVPAADSCYCYQRSEYFAEVRDKVQAFRDCCSSFTGYSSHEC